MRQTAVLDLVRNLSQRRRIRNSSPTNWQASQRGSDTLSGGRRFRDPQSHENLTAAHESDYDQYSRPHSFASRNTLWMKGRERARQTRTTRLNNRAHMLTSGQGIRRESNVNRGIQTMHGVSDSFRPHIWLRK